MVDVVDAVIVEFVIILVTDDGVVVVEFVSGVVFTVTFFVEFDIG